MNKLFHAFVIGEIYTSCMNVPCSPLAARIVLTILLQKPADSSVKELLRLKQL